MRQAARLRRTSMMKPPRRGQDTYWGSQQASAPPKLATRLRNIVAPTGEGRQHDNTHGTSSEALLTAGGVLFP